MSAQTLLNPSIHQLLIESLHDAVIAVNSEGVILTWNRAATSLFGYTAEESVGHPLARIVPACDRLCNQFSDPPARPTRTALHETIAYTKDGREISLELTITLVNPSEALLVNAPETSLVNATGSSMENCMETSAWAGSLSDNSLLTDTPIYVLTIRVSAILDGQGPFLRMLADNSQDIITYTVLDRGIVYVSPSIQTLLGYAPHDIVSGEVKFTYHPDDEVVVHAFREAVSKGANAYRFTARLKHQQGNYVWFETTFKVTREAASGRIGILGIGRDISSRKELQSRFEHAQRIARVGHWERRFTDNSVYWSDEVYHICGLATSQPITREILDRVIHPHDKRAVAQAFKDAENGSPYDMEYRIVRPDGEVRFIHSQGEHLYDRDVLVGMFGSLQDITDRKHVEEALRRSKEGLKLAHRIAGLGHWDMDLRSGELFISDELYRMWGMSPVESGNSPVAHRKDIEQLVSAVHPEDLEQIQVMRDAAMTRSPFDVEFRVIHPDNSLRVVRCVSQFISDSDGTFIRLFGIVQDNTERKQTEEMLKRSEMLSVVGQLAAGLAHEIRNPLTSIKGFTQLLATGLNTSYLGIMKSELGRIESIVNELLALAKPQAVIYKRTELSSILKDVISLLDVQAIMVNVRLLSCLGEELFVECDSNQLKQVFINIIKNGIESMPGGGNLYINVIGKPGFVVITFQDEGEGIAPDVLRSLGQPFISTKPKGVGLGFMISQKIIQDHGGTIDVESTVGVGTKVSVSLPVPMR